MPSARHATQRVDFHRTKYGPEILIDIAWVHEMPTFILTTPHWLAFYDILLVTRGRGWFSLDGEVGYGQHSYELAAKMQRVVPEVTDLGRETKRCTICTESTARRATISAEPA